MSITIGSVYLADLTSSNCFLSGIRSVIILDVKSDGEILVMPISHTTNKDKFKNSSEVELELFNPVSNKLGTTNVVNGAWSVIISKDKLLSKSIGIVKSIKMKMEIF